MIDATHRKATAGVAACARKGGRGRPIGRSKGAMTTKPHAVTDAKNRPIRLLMPAGQKRRPHYGAAALLGCLPGSDWLLAARGQDADPEKKSVGEQGNKSVRPRRGRRKTAR